MPRPYILYALITIAPVMTVEASDCRERLFEIDTKRAAANKSPDDVRRDLRELRRSAILLLDNGKEELCHEVANSMEQIIEERKESRAQAEWIAELASATSLSKLDRVVRSTEMEGTTVRNLEGVELGSIEALAIDSNTGSVAYAVLSHGGILGLGEKRIGIPWVALRLSVEGDVYVLDVSERALDSAPDLDEIKWPTQVDTPWWKGEK